MLFYLVRQMMPSLTVFLPQTKVLLLWLYSPLLYARNGCKTPFNSPEPQSLFNEHLWLYCSFLKKDKTKNHAHNRHSINISEWKNEEIFCKCHPHSLISKHGLGVGNFQPNIRKHFRSLCDCCFFPQAISALMHANGALGYENFMPCLIALPC